MRRPTSKIAQLGVVFLCSIALLGLVVGYQIGQRSASQNVSTSTPAFDHIVTILMENNGYCDVMTTCGGSGTYMTSLAQSYSVVSQTGYGAVDHPSEPNYIALIGGGTLGISGDGNCCGQLSSPNIIDRIEASGRTWQAWAEDAGNTGTCSFSPPRSADHFPFLEFSDITNNSTRCAHFQTTGSSSDTEFLTSLNATSPPNYIWLTPNDNDNCHDTSIPTCDAYVASLVPKILKSNLFKTQKAALFIVYDEGGGAYPSDYVYATWAGPIVKTGYTGTGSYTHYSYLKTLETVWGMPSLTSNDAGASPMTEFFGTSTPPALSTSFTVSATPLVSLPVTFTSTTTGGKPPYTVTWNFGDETLGTGATTTHIFTSAQAFTVAETATDSSSPTQTATSSQQVTVANPTQLTASFTNTPTTPWVNTTVSFTATAAGGIPPYSYNWSFGDNHIGTGQTKSNTYTATGTFSVVLNVTDALQHVATASSTITVAALPPPDYSIISTPSSLTILQSQSDTSTVAVTSLNQFSGTVSFTASADNGLTVSLSQSNITLSSGATQDLMLTVKVPAQAAVGTYSATVTATSGSTLHPAYLVVTVTLNHLPQLTIPGAISVDTSSAVSFTVTATDPDPSLALTLSVSNLPPGATFDPTTGFFRWTPTPSQAGTYTLTFTATDNGSPPMTNRKDESIIVKSGASPSQPTQGGNCSNCGFLNAIVSNLWAIIAVAVVAIAVLTIVYGYPARLNTLRRLKR